MLNYKQLSCEQAHACDVRIPMLKFLGWNIYKFYVPFKSLEICEITKIDFVMNCKRKLFKNYEVRK